MEMADGYIRGKGDMGASLASPPPSGYGLTYLYIGKCIQTFDQKTSRKEMAWRPRHTSKYYVQTNYNGKGCSLHEGASGWGPMSVFFKHAEPSHSTRKKFLCQLCSYELLKEDSVK
jgi:hypothetical protein